MCGPEELPREQIDCGKGNGDINLGQEQVGPVRNAGKLKKASNHPWQERGMQVVGQHPFLPPGKVHHAVTVEFVPGQSRQKGPHHHMDDEEKHEQPVRLLILDAVA